LPHGEHPYDYGYSLRDDEELCDHSYAGDDGDVGRCYCGAQLYPKGGRVVVDLRGVLIRAADALRTHGVHPVEAEVRALIAALDEEVGRV
jgi:hypothetical protein